MSHFSYSSPVNTQTDIKTASQDNLSSETNTFKFKTTSTLTKLDNAAINSPISTIKHQNIKNKKHQKYSHTNHIRYVGGVPMTEQEAASSVGGANGGCDGVEEVTVS